MTTMFQFDKLQRPGGRRAPLSQLGALLPVVNLTDEANAGRIAPAIDTAGEASSLYDRMAQTLYCNKDTGETIVRHTVTDDAGRVVDDHFRPNYKPRTGDLNDEQ